MKKSRENQKHSLLAVRVKKTNNQMNKKEPTSLDEIMILYYLKRIFENTFSKETGILNLLWSILLGYHSRYSASLCILD